jgi:hypothetical protein
MPESPAQHGGLWRGCRAPQQPDTQKEKESADTYRHCPRSHARHALPSWIAASLVFYLLRAVLECAARPASSFVVVPQRVRTSMQHGVQPPTSLLYIPVQHRLCCFPALQRACVLAAEAGSSDTLPGSPHSYDAYGSGDGDTIAAVVTGQTRRLPSLWAPCHLPVSTIAVFLARTRAQLRQQWPGRLERRCSATASSASVHSARQRDRWCSPASNTREVGPRRAAGRGGGDRAAVWAGGGGRSTARLPAEWASAGRFFGALAARDAPRVPRPSGRCGRHGPG